jgi:hypothetical protein
MTGQEELDQIRIYKERVEEQRMYIAELRSAMSGLTWISYDKDSVQTSPDADPMLDKIMKIEKAEKKLKHLEEVWVSWKIMCIDRIHMMDVGDLQKILYLIYIHDRTLKDVAEEMCWSYDYMKKRHRDAVREYENISP